MRYKAVIFDMDGLLIDSEPYWEEAGSETLAEFGKVLTQEQYSSSTGLRTEEWITHWFRFFDISMQHVTEATNTIIQKAIDKIAAKAEPMDGVDHILHFFRENNFQIALASSSPMELIDVVVDKLNIRLQFQIFTSAQHLAFGKPHPEVFLNCANELGRLPTECIVFEDSFNGMIAAKAARMKCVVVPSAADHAHLKWNAADLILPKRFKKKKVTPP
ncbi:MAG: hexitol phosphatase HxpB [Chitinophagaceae bacterium]|nr:hexitol phosphatase HxpB [Chitinophagaceae bacterium]